jgi:hypothetical protein
MHDRAIDGDPTFLTWSKAIIVPSGDQLGSLELYTSRVSGTAPPVSRRRSEPSERIT